MTYMSKYPMCPKASSTLLPKIQRNHMLNRTWPTLPWRNIEVSSARNTFFSGKIGSWAPSRQTLDTISSAPSGKPVVTSQEMAARS